ncbi:TPM domain-containing protein [Schaalia sp. lx-100]|uniref:TPM domain-containing protein n=1 Tax=Schaalia sp. lx-100 TaxID=2899081 RepID=UPI001E5A4679|nr:TPM domain-containing protein [Schaalia sp. lx-100]MCD4557509.1 TPM domain-containing protein [Schaalia sp. lx-100]
MGKSKTRQRARSVRVRHSAVILSFFLLVVMLFAGQVRGAQAENTHVIDEVDALSASEKSDLESLITPIISEYHQDIVVLFASLNQKSPKEYADDYFDDHGYGVGQKRSGVLLLIAPDSRDWWISTRGDSISTFTDKDIQHIGDLMKKELRREQWAAGAQVFVEQSRNYMRAWNNGEKSENTSSTSTDILIKIGSVCVFVIVAGIIGLLSVHFLFVRKMRNIGVEPRAFSHIVPGSFTLTRESERLVSSHVQRVKIRSESGSSTHISSSGASHGGGGGKF